MKRDEEHISFLDPIRGVAILSVFLFHTVYNSFWYFQHSTELVWNGAFIRHIDDTAQGDKSLLVILPATLGWVGVAIFFVVSGFCIHLSHERSRLKSFKVFFIRRFFRIYPPYLLAMLACAMVYPLTHAHTDARMADMPGQIISHIFLYFTLFDAYHGGINASLWSIAVESQLYLLYPLLLWLALRFGWRHTLWVTALIELSFRSAEGIKQFYHPWANPGGDFIWWYTYMPLSFWFSWSVGAVLAEAYLKKQPLPFLKMPGWIWAVLFGVCYMVRPLFPFCFPLAALTTASVIAYLLSRPAFELPSKGWLGLPLRHLRWVGIVSYSAYLLHGPILSQVPKVVSVALHGQHLSPLLMFAACLLSWPVVIGLASIFYRFVELPSIAWGKRIIKRISEPPAAPAPVATVVLPEKT